MDVVDVEAVEEVLASESDLLINGVLSIAAGASAAGEGINGCEPVPTAKPILRPIRGCIASGIPGRLPAVDGADRLEAGVCIASCRSSFRSMVLPLPCWEIGNPLGWGVVARVVGVVVDEGIAVCTCHPIDILYGRGVNNEHMFSGENPMMGKNS